MAGKKNLQVNFQNISTSQAANLAADIIKAKNKHAPDARAEMLIGSGKKLLGFFKRKELGSGDE